jgi:N-acetylglucosamine-6-phosphate deacetylase
LSRLLFENARLVDPEGISPTRGGLLIQGGRISDVLPSGAAACAEAGVRRLDLAGRALAPGFLDLHYHGGIVLDDATDPRTSLLASSASLVRYGTTAFLPTTVAWPQEVLTHRVDGLSEALDAGAWPGAMPLGIHLEGPWIRPEAAGAQPSGGIRPYCVNDARDVLDRAGCWLRLVTLAPEVPGARALLAELARRGVVAALGHSLAEAEEVEAGIQEGLQHVTHLFNAMGPLHHRERSTAALALADDRLSCDLICDGIHVHPGMVRVAARAKGEGLMLISDRVELPESSEQAASWGSGRLRDDGETVRLGDGRLAASRLTLDRALQNLRAFAELGLSQAVAACTLRPARLLGMEAQRGTLRPGARADLVVMEDSGRVLQTWIGGRLAYEAEAAAIGAA